MLQNGVIDKTGGEGTRRDERMRRGDGGYRGNFHYQHPPLLRRLPRRRVVWYCQGPEGKRGHYGGPSDPLHKEKADLALTLFRALNLSVQSRCQRVLIYLLDSLSELSHYLHHGGQ